MSDGETGRVHAAGCDAVAAFSTISLALGLGHGRRLLGALPTHISGAYWLRLTPSTSPTYFCRRSRLFTQILHVQILGCFEMADSSTTSHRELRIRFCAAHSQVTHRVLTTMCDATFESE